MGGVATGTTLSGVLCGKTPFRDSEKHKAVFSSLELQPRSAFFFFPAAGALPALFLPGNQFAVVKAPRSLSFYDRSDFAYGQCSLMRVPDSSVAIITGARNQRIR
jgi:hypothetical protein